MNIRFINIAKIIIIAIITLIFVLAMSNIVIAAYNVKGTFTGTVSDLKGADSKLKNIIGTVLDITRFVGTAIALIMLMYVGLKFIIASPGEKASIQQYLINYVIGAFILIGASGIITIIKNAIQTATNI